MEKGKVIKQCAGTCIFWLLLLVVLGRIYQILSWKDSAGEYITPVETFYGLEENVVDVLFLGSSHCYCSVINAQLWRDYGIAGYSLSISGQDIAASYYWLKEALKTQKPKVVCLEMFGATYHGYSVEGNLYRNTLPHHMSADYLCMVRDLIDEESGSLQTEGNIVSEGDRNSFLAKWPIIHTRYRELQRQDFTGPDTLYIGYCAPTEGLRYEPITWARNGEELYTGDETVEMEEEAWLRKIVDLARENGVDLCLFLAPMSVTVQDQMRMNYVEELAKEEGIPFLNFVDLREEQGFDTEQDFMDWGHLNYRGAEKVTAALGEFITENYALEDHRGDSRYALWERDLVFREHEFDCMDLQQSTDIGTVLDHTLHSGGYTVIVAADGDYFRETDALEDCLTALEIEEEFRAGGGIWIVENGQAVWKNASDTGEWYMERNAADIVLFRTDGVSRIIVDGKDCTKVSNGINITFYDNILKRVIYAAGFSPADDGYICVR